MCQCDFTSCGHETLSEVDVISFKVGELLGKRGMFNITAAAKEIGVTRQTLASILKGNVSRIELDTLDRLCAYFECQPGDLMFYSTPDFEVVIENIPPSSS